MPVEMRVLTCSPSWLRHSVSVSVNTFGTAKVEETKIERAINKEFDLRPAGIINRLDLLLPIYFETSRHGHFGRKGFAWESTEPAAALRASCGL